MLSFPVNYDCNISALLVQKQFYSLNVKISRFEIKVRPFIILC